MKSIPKTASMAAAPALGARWRPATRTYPGLMDSILELRLKTARADRDAPSFREAHRRAANRGGPGRGLTSSARSSRRMGNRADARPGLNPPHLGKLIRESMDEVGWNVTETAARLGCERGTLSRLPNGKAGVSATMALALEALGCGDGRSLDADAGELRACAGPNGTRMAGGHGGTRCGPSVARPRSIRWWLLDTGPLGGQVR